MPQKIDLIAKINKFKSGHSLHDVWEAQEENSRCHQPTQDKKGRDPTPTSDKIALESGMRTSKGGMEGREDASKDKEGEGRKRERK